jgi:hypothetical protein
MPNAAKAKQYAWNLPPLAEWSIVGMNHYRAAGARNLFVAMSKDGRLIKSEGADEDLVFADLIRQATEADALAILQPPPRPPRRPADACAKSLDDLVTPKQLSMIRAGVKKREKMDGADVREVAGRADEICLAELKCKIEELSKDGAAYFIAFLRGDCDGEAAPATAVQKGDVTTRKNYLRTLREFHDDELRREIAATGCLVPAEITAGECARLIERLDALIYAAEQAAAPSGGKVKE